MSFRFVFALPGPPEPAAALDSYIKNGAGTVQGVTDPEKQVQIEFWQRAAKEGFTDERARASAQKFRTEFDALDRTLAKQPYLMGSELSVLDIAWFIYEHRLSLAGYPFARLHPHVHAWAESCAPCRNSPRRSDSFAIRPSSSTPSAARRPARPSKRSRAFSPKNLAVAERPVRKRNGRRKLPGIPAIFEIHLAGRIGQFASASAGGAPFADFERDGVRCAHSWHSG